jgi:hypothetical protein
MVDRSRAGMARAGMAHDLAHEHAGRAHEKDTYRIFNRVV